MQIQFLGLLCIWKKPQGILYCKYKFYLPEIEYFEYDLSSYFPNVNNFLVPPILPLNQPYLAKRNVDEMSMSNCIAINIEALP